MFSEDINFIYSYSKDNINDEIKNKKKTEELIKSVKILIESLKNENLSESTKDKINNIAKLIWKILILNKNWNVGCSKRQELNLKYC